LSEVIVKAKKAKKLREMKNQNNKTIDKNQSLSLDNSVAAAVDEEKEPTDRALNILQKVGLAFKNKIKESLI
jgi:hypothetical protein